MSFTKNKEHSDKVLLYILSNDLKNENERLKQDNKRMRKLINQLVISFLIVVCCFVYVIVKN